MSKKNKLFTADEDQFIKENYLQLSSIKMAAHLKRSKFGVLNRMKKLELKLPDNVLRLRKTSTQFKKGGMAFNKGKKMDEFLKPSTIKKLKASQFKKGHKPHNTLHDGKITMRKDKRGIPHKFIRIDKREWQAYQRYVWEKAHGEIAPGNAILFIDKNTLNCDIENLKMVNAEELMLMNTIHRYPEEIKELIRLTAKLNRTIKKTEENGTK